MSIEHLLEDFGSYGVSAPVSMTDISLEETRLEAFENGYQAGWDDAVKAQLDDSNRVSTDLAQNLHDLSFTYQEAYTAVLNSLKPFLQQLVETVLPQISHQTLGTHVAAVLHEIAIENNKLPVEIVSAPVNRLAIEEMVSQERSLPLTIVEEASLGDGQVYIRFGAHEREINLAEVLSEIDLAVSGFFDEINMETA